MNFAEMVAAFLRLEDEGGFFDASFGGVAIWDVIRPYVVASLYAQMVGTADAPLPSPEPLSTRAGAWREALSRERNPWLMPPADVFAWGHPRRQRLDDGLYWDLYLDPLLDAAPLPVNYVEEATLLGHLQPARTRQARYAEAVSLVAALAYKVARPRPTRAERDGVRQIESELNRRFGTRVELGPMAERYATLFAQLRPAFRILFERMKARALVLTTAYCFKWMTEAARDLGIQSIELQHGYAGELHVGYAYRQSQGRNRFLPDHFFSWGDYWNPSLRTMLPAERTHAVGYAHFHECRRRYQRSSRSSAGPLRVLMISQGASITSPLTRVAVELARDERYAVTMRLHPGADRDWRRIYPHLADSAVRVEEGNARNFYLALNDADAVVGVCSTSLFESVGWGLPTFVHRTPAYEYMLPLLERGLAAGFDSVDELRALLDAATSPGTASSEALFGVAPVETFWASLRRVAHLG